MISDVMTHYEAEHYIQNLLLFEIEDFGNRKWISQDEILQKLNMQAHVNALGRSDEFIMESMVTFEKIKLLIYDLVMSECWKQFVYPHLQKELSEVYTIRSYTVLQHEAIVCNLLQVMLYHRTAVEAADSYLLEVIDYCYRKLAYTIAHPQPKKLEKKTIEYFNAKTKIDDLKEQAENVEFQLAMMSLSIIRFISDYAKFLPINVVHQLIVENDVFLLIVPLIEEKPWLRVNSRGEREVFEQNKWIVVEKADYSRLPKVEAQAWITIFNLFMEPEVRRKYELTEFKKNNLTKLRKYMNELLLDQIPQLVDLLRALEELTIMNVQPISKAAIVVQSMPEIRAAICKGKNWREIADNSRKYFQNDETIQEDIKRYAELYNNQIFEGIVEGYKCVQCQKEATKRCSRCKQVWYCSKECQVSNWPSHKTNCQQKTAEPKKVENDLDKID